MTKWSTPEDLITLPPDAELIEETALAMAQATIQNAMTAAQIRRADLAAKMERPRSFVSRMLKGDHNLTIKTFARALAACGFELRFNYLPIQSSTIISPVHPRPVRRESGEPSTGILPKSLAPEVSIEGKSPVDSPGTHQ
jgi:plasmid maintenance system antidote protein VapI